MDVLLTHSNHVFYDEKQRQKMEPYPPLQTLLAAAALRESGVHVEVCDVALESPEENITQALSRATPGLVFVCEDDFNFLTKMCLSRNRELAFWIAGTARDHGWRLAVHGSDATDHVEDYLDAGFDYVLIGEVEETICELAGGRLASEIAGLAYRDKSTERTCRTGPRVFRERLDGLPRPAWDLIDIGPYREAWRARHDFFSLNLVSSRGCPFRCNWCAKPIYGHNYRVRSASSVAGEMQYLKAHYKPDHIWFADDIFALSARWTKEFADSVEDLQTQTPFKMQSRCDLMTREVVADIKRAGCQEVWMGAESGSQRVLNAMEKGTKVEQIYKARENLNRNEIRVGFFLQFGYPGEDWSDIQSTIRMVRAARPNDIGISVTYPLPGTKLHQLVSSDIGKKTNWRESGDLSMMFRGAFSTDLYRALARALHLEVRTPHDKQGIANAWAQVGAIKDDEVCMLEAVS